MSPIAERMGGEGGRTQPGVYPVKPDDKLIIDNWREKEATCDSIKIEIHNCLYNDATGLPENYTEDEISQKTDIVFKHIFRVYNTANPEVYEVA
jgi:type I restriction enzyme R subunit